jgi:predicted MPP superfamily phosphohydrolase
VLSLAAVGVLCMGYAYFVEPYWPRVSTYQIATSKLPKGAGPIRVVHISDTHCDAKVRLEDRLPEIIAGLKPDLILFTGDAVNSSEGIGVFRRLMTRLSAIAPTYAVRGNWEYESYRDVDLYTGTGVRELRGQVVLKDIRGTPVYLVGVAWPDWTAAKRLQDLPPPGGLSIMMYHTPDLVSQIPIKSDLVLVGHTHGGQIALPLYGGMITLAREGKKYERDMYDLPGGQKLHVSRGIGMEGGNAPRMRFFSRPDVSVIEIVPRERP